MVQVQAPVTTDIRNRTLDQSAQVLQVYVLPVSGGSFPAQLAGLSLLGENIEGLQPRVPDIVLASSGGNIATYLAMAGCWHWAGIERSVRQLQKCWFSRPWTAIPLLNLVYSYTRRCYRAAGLGFLEFIAKNFTSTTIQQPEVWTSAYNKTEQRGHLYCNRGREEAQLCLASNQLLVNNLDSPTYAEGNLALIADYCLASASIPHMVPPVEINGRQIIDGGVSGASPLTAMSSTLIHHPADVLHLTYFSYGDIESNLPSPPGNGALTEVLNTVGALIKSLAIADRARACAIISERLAPNQKLTVLNCSLTSQTLILIDRLRDLGGSTMLEIYSEDNTIIDVYNFDAEHVIHAMKNAREKLRARLTYVTGLNPVMEEAIINRLRELDAA